MKNIENKKFIRKKYLKIRNNFTQKYIDKISENIAKNLIKLDEYNKSKNIFIFISIKKEINTKYIIKMCIKDKKNVYIPCIIKEKKKIIFRKFTGYDNLAKASFGTLEPTCPYEKISDEHTLIVVPAVVYAKDKHRIGYGGGYYDKFLKEHTYLTAIGVCYDNFLIQNFEKNNYDISVDKIVTEKSVYI